MGRWRHWQRLALDRRTRARVSQHWDYIIPLIFKSKLSVPKKKKLIEFGIRWNSIHYWSVISGGGRGGTEQSQETLMHSDTYPFTTPKRVGIGAAVVAPRRAKQTKAVVSASLTIDAGGIKLGETSSTKKHCN